METMNRINTLTLTEAEALIIGNLLVQMSDGWLKDDPFYEPYWKNLNVHYDLANGWELHIYRKNNYHKPEVEEYPLWNKPLETMEFLAETVEKLNGSNGGWFKTECCKESRIDDEDFDRIIASWKKKDYKGPSVIDIALPTSTSVYTKNEPYVDDHGIYFPIHEYSTNGTGSEYYRIPKDIFVEAYKRFINGEKSSE